MPSWNPLPPRYAETLDAYHTVAEHILAAARYRAVGRIGLEPVRGGFATPLLVGDANAGAVPLLAYLALLDIALFAVASRRGWSWLVASGVLLSFAWTAVLIFAKPARAQLSSSSLLLAPLTPPASSTAPPRIIGKPPAKAVDPKLRLAA